MIDDYLIKRYNNRRQMSAEQTAGRLFGGSRFMRWDPAARHLLF